MPILTEIKYSQLGDRFDSEYYHPLKLNYLRELGKLSQSEEVSNNFISVREIFDPNSFKEKGKLVKVVRLEDIANFFISKFQVCKAWEVGSQKKIFKTGDILISRLRSYLKEITFVTNFDDGINLCSTEFIVLRPKEQSKVFPTFLFSFLLTKQAQTILQWSQEGSNHPRFPENVLLSIKIPLPPKPFQDKIDKIVRDAFSKRNLADQKYEQAKQLLEKELGLNKLKLKEEKTFETKFSNLNIGNRFDVEFHKPLYSEIKALLETGEKKEIFVIKKLKDIDNKPSKGIEIGSDAYADKGYLFLRVSNLSEKEITIGPSSQFVRPYLYEQLKSKYKPEIGEVLYTKDATIGVSFVVDKDFDEFIPSGGIIRIKPKDVDPYYLSLVLNSLICKAQSERYSIGAVIKHFTFENVKNLKVPTLPKPQQEQISKLVKESFSLRKESRILIDKAKEEVEKLVEGEK